MAIFTVLEASAEHFLFVGESNCICCNCHGVDIGLVDLQYMHITENLHEMV